MVDIGKVQVPAPVAVAPPKREGQRRREPDRRAGVPAGARRETVAALLREHGVAPDDTTELILQLVTDLADGSTRVRVWDQRMERLLVEVSAEEFAAAASAHQTYEGLLVERDS